MLQNIWKHIDDFLHIPLKSVAASVLIAGLIIGIIFAAANVTIRYMQALTFYSVGKFNTLPEPQPIKPEWLKLPLNKFHIKSSHNTYVDGLQHGSKSSHKAIMETLRLGARVIELDVSIDKFDGRIVVGHGNKFILTTVPISLRKVFNQIATNKQLYRGEPLLIFLELYGNNNSHLVHQINLIAESEFGSRLVRADQGIDVSNEPLENLMNRIILFSGLNMHEDLTCVNKYLHGGFNNRPIDHHTAKKELPDDNRIQRIYGVGLTGIISKNFNAIPYMKAKKGIIAMNWSFPDQELYNYIKSFGSYNFVPFDEWEVKNKTK